MPNKVYAITADLRGSKTISDAFEKTFQLDADIQRLAKKTGADVHMHQYVEPLEGVPQVLVEAPEAFIEQVKHLPKFGGAHPIDVSETPTIRRTDAPQIEPPEAIPHPGPPRPPRKPNPPKPPRR